MKRIATTLAFTLTVSLFGLDQASQAAQSGGRRSDPAAVRKAIEKSLPLLESIRLPFIEKTGCVSCHNNSLPAMAAAMARERGFKSNERTSLEESEQILGIWSAGRERLLQGDGFGGAQAAASNILLGLAANKQPPNKTTDAIVLYLIGRQVADGRWPVATNRPPSESSDIAVTALSLRALQLYAPKGLRQEVNNCVERAREWLAKAAPRNNGDQAFQLLGLAWANADKQALQKMAQALLARQHKDGGWGQYLTMESDAYATGEALVALHQAGGLPVMDRAYQRGVNYLLGDQAADGSWAVLSRSFPFQKQFESGFPYGRNQWISAAASSWATMALILTVEAPVNLISGGAR
ncbi:MAG TPA: prenyltransferase/squalene oxidase repeat-containing protein [Blastocatellia bacterium]|nr:prenyltransferase/squalene oxidase repeat-containing protein [Blastocatellia bacterium]